MKSKVLGLGIVATLALLGQSQNVNAIEVDGPTTTVECPNGDKYLCYTNAEGLNVRKGKGKTIVTIAP